MSASPEDLVQLIVGLLKPWADPYQQRDVIAGINEEIAVLKAAFPELSREGVIATRASAKRLLPKIARLQHEIARLQHELDEKASPEMRMRLSAHVSAMKRECDAAIQGTLTEGRRNQVKEWCVKKAWALICKFSEKRPTSGSTDSPFRHIAGLLCKIIDSEGHMGARNRGKPTDGDEIPDFERGCEDFLKEMALVQKPKKPSDL
jgi:hypothetical protein